MKMIMKTSTVGEEELDVTMRSRSLLHRPASADSVIRDPWGKQVQREGTRTMMERDSGRS